MASKNYILELDSSFLEGIVEGELREFKLESKKYALMVGSPIFLSDLEGDIIGIIMINKYDVRGQFPEGEYRVLKIFNEQDKKQ